MKLFKGLVAIMIIAMVVISCDSKKKDNPTKDNTEVVTKGDKTACAKDCKKACCAKKEAHKCDDNCKKNGCSAHSDKKACAKDCKKACCAKDHKCSDAKCSADCKDVNCLKCKAKQAECKVHCATKKGADTVKDGLKKAGDAVKDGTNAVKDGAKKAGNTLKTGADKLKKAVH